MLTYYRAWRSNFSQFCIVNPGGNHHANRFSTRNCSEFRHVVIILHSLTRNSCSGHSDSRHGDHYVVIDGCHSRTCRDGDGTAFERHSRRRSWRTSWRSRVDCWCGSSRNTPASINSHFSEGYMNIQFTVDILYQACLATSWTTLFRTFCTSYLAY